jgi:hypothetical protein
VKLARRIKYAFAVESKLRVALQAQSSDTRQRSGIGTAVPRSVYLQEVVRGGGDRAPFKAVGAPDDSLVLKVVATACWPKASKGGRRPGSPPGRPRGRRFLGSRFAASVTPCESVGGSTSRPWGDSPTASWYAWASWRGRLSPYGFETGDEPCARLADGALVGLVNGHGLDRNGLSTSCTSVVDAIGFAGRPNVSECSRARSRGSRRTPRSMLRAADRCAPSARRCASTARPISRRRRRAPSRQRSASLGGGARRRRRQARASRTTLHRERFGAYRDVGDE